MFYKSSLVIYLPDHGCTDKDPHHQQQERLTTIILARDHLAVFCVRLVGGKSYVSMYTYTYTMQRRDAVVVRTC